MATENTAKARRIIAKLNKTQNSPGLWLVADAMKGLVQDIEAMRTELDELNAPPPDSVTILTGRN